MKILTLLLLLFYTPLNSNQNILLKEQIHLSVKDFDGWASEEKISTFVDILCAIKPKVCVEIGVYAGKSFISTAMILSHLKDGLLIGIDPWKNAECIKFFDPIEKQVDIAWWKQVDLEAMQQICIQSINKYKLNPFCKLIASTSSSAIDEIPTIDFLHIDGSLSEGLRALDVQLYLPKVRAGGYICLNDSIYVESQPAIQLLLESCDVIQLIDLGNCIIFRKRS